MTRPELMCPKCGAEMNHQADKLVQPVTQEEATTVGVTLDGLLERVFACPHCGWIDSRREAGAPATS